MKVCRLCKAREADKKGSHLVPHFLIKRVDNIDSKTERDYELGFAIGEFDTEFYFGRSVSPEKLEETFGELTDEEIEGSRSPLIVDFYFCSHCEDRLSKIESEYSKTLSTFDKEKEYSSGLPSAVGLLFWISVFWRMSIHQQSGTYVSDEENDAMRVFLDRFLLVDTSKIDQAIKEANEGDSMSYKLIRCPNFSHDHVTHMCWHPLFRKAYSLLIDEFVVVLSITDDYSEHGVNDFLELSSKFEVTTKNTTSGQERVRPITVLEMERAISILVGLAAAQRNNRMNELWDELHRAIGGEGTVMPEMIKQEIRREMSSEEKKMGRKHNKKEIEACTIRVVMKYEQFYNKNR